MLLLLSFRILHVSAHVRSVALQTDTSYHYSRPSYISLSTGVNNNVGFIGVCYEKRFYQDLAVEAGAGVSTWGLKLNAEGKFYFIPYRKRWALGTGITYCNGYRNKRQDMYVIGMGSSGYQPVTVDFEPQWNAHISLYHYYIIDNNTRFYLQFGWTQRLHETEIIAKPPNQLNHSSTEYYNTIFLRSPGGLILACGFSFKISGNKKAKEKRP